MDFVRSLQRTDVEWDSIKVKIAFGYWWRKAVDIVGTKDRAFSFFQFLDAWRRCPKQPEGLDVERLLSSSESVRLPVRFDHYSDQIKTILKCCIVLTSYYNGPFYLSAENAGRLIGSGKQSGWEKLKRLREDGILERIGEKGSNLTGTANWYRLLLIGV
jgi:hypothetical protein